MIGWREVALAAAVGLETAAATLAVQGHQTVALSLHLLAGAGTAAGMEGRLAEGPSGWAFAFGMALFVPLFGTLGCVATALHRPAGDPSHHDDWVRTPIPSGEESGAGTTGTSAGAALHGAKARVAAARRHDDARSIDLLRRALENPDEDLRLVAHAVLESKSRAAYRSIHEVTRQLDDAPRSRRAHVHRRVAREHWELARAGLADGECLDYALDQARHHAQSYLLQAGGCAATHLLLGQVELRRGDPQSAEAALARAVELGVPRQLVQPYLAEAAFLGRRLGLVGPRLAEACSGHAAVDRVRRFWS
jgi:hypothetical protein